MDQAKALRSALSGHRPDPIWMTALISILIGSVLYFILFSAEPLHPTNVNWIYTRGGDLLQEQLGWMAYRSEPWQSQIGVIASYPYPGGTSVVYTNLVPIMAVFFKLLNPLLPDSFQFVGLWGILCWILQVYFTLRILEEMNCTRAIRYGGATLLAFAPVLVNRAFLHDPLCAQWLILAGFWLALRSIHGKSGFRLWPFLLLLSVWIHAYLFFMLLFLFAGALAIEIQSTGKWKESAGVLLLSGGICLGSAYLLGMFNISPRMPITDIRNYSINGNTWINPGKSSTFFRQQGLAFDGQYEGFAYLGLGGFLLVSVVLIAWNGFSEAWRTGKKYLPISIPVLCMALLSTGGTMTWGKQVLFSVMLPEGIIGLLSIIRSLGRFIWPLYYLMFLFALTIFDRRGGKTGWLVVLILLQAVDIAPLANQKSFVQNTEYRSPLVSQFWQEMPENYRHIVLLPDEEIEEEYQPYAIYGLQHQLTINWAYVARGDYTRMVDGMAQAEQDLLSGQADPTTIYVTRDEDFASRISTLQNEKLIVCREKDHWLIVPVDGDRLQVLRWMDRCQ